MFSRSRLEHYSAPHALKDLIKHTRIVVIDDAPDEFPFKVLKDQGYAIDYWPDVKDLFALESGFYDIIVLDIGGIGHQLDEHNEGVAVLRHLKKVNPLQTIIAYSGQSHKSERIPFFELADQYVPKPGTAITWKEILDDLLPKIITVDHFWSALQTVLRTEGATPRQIRRLERQLVKAAKGRVVDFRGAVRRHLGTVENMATIASIASKLLAICAA